MNECAFSPRSSLNSSARVGIYDTSEPMCRWQCTDELAYNHCYFNFIQSNLRKSDWKASSTTISDSFRLMSQLNSYSAPRVWGESDECHFCIESPLTARLQGSHLIIPDYLIYPERCWLNNMVCYRKVSPLCLCSWSDLNSLARFYLQYFGFIRWTTSSLVNRLSFVCPGDFYLSDTKTCYVMWDGSTKKKTSLQSPDGVVLWQINNTNDSPVYNSSPCLFWTLISVLYI